MWRDFWNIKQRALQITLITLMQRHLSVHSTEGLPIAADPAKEDPHGTDRPDWMAPLCRLAAKVSRQVLRFLKHGSVKPASPGAMNAS